jgi:geranylgeranylglycerol-phosphate geranylgeranyltransferase
MHFSSYIKIIRWQNAAMAAGAVLLGAWISRSDLGNAYCLLLAFAAFFSTGFGNIINDIIDIESDRISHPSRPLPKGLISKRSAWIYCILCAGTALFCSFSVAPIYGYATLLPLALLIVYAFHFKGTPLAGNIIISLLVAYSLLFGSLDAENRVMLYLPATLAMLLNFSREIIKDLQDEQGDRATGVVTSASLSPILLKKVLFVCDGVYVLLLFAPVIIGTCGKGYLITVLITVLPLHAIRLFHFVKSSWTSRCGLLSSLLKFEMLAGLLALTIDRVLQ